MLTHMPMNDLQALYSQTFNHCQELDITLEVLNDSQGGHWTGEQFKLISQSITRLTAQHGQLRDYLAEIVQEIQAQRAVEDAA